MIQRRQTNGPDGTVLLGSQGQELPRQKDYKKETFFTRIRKSTEARQLNSTTRIRTILFFRGLMLFQGCTELYALCCYIIPYVYQDYSPMGIYYVKVVAWFAITNMIANWACVILYDTSYQKTKDNPDLLSSQKFDTPPEHFVYRIQDRSNGHSVYNMGTSEELPWRYCDKCKMNAPYRAHHCAVCQKCILKKDHHCYLVGNCIGFKNQRYFIMMLFYVGIVGLGGGNITLQYVKAMVSPGFEKWTDAVLPLTIWRSIFGNIKWWHCLLIFHIYVEFIFGFLACVYFVLQMTMISDGKTLYEAQKKVPVKISNSVNKNIKSVFGDFWGLNFLFPMTLIFRQREDGIHWTGVKLLNKSMNYRKT